MCCEERESYGCDDCELGNGIDCDGILSLWVHSIILEEWESIEGGRVARGGELLFAGVVVSSQEEYAAPSTRTALVHIVGYQAR